MANHWNDLLEMLTDNPLHAMMVIFGIILFFYITSQQTYEIAIFYKIDIQILGKLRKKNQMS